MASGRQINRAADNAAGLAIAEIMQNQIRGLDQALRNTRDASSLISTAEGAMGEISEVLGRVRELTVQASNDTLSREARGAINAEISQLLQEVDQISQNTEFNTQQVLQGAEYGFQTGANAGQRMEAVLGTMDLAHLGLSNYGDLFADASVQNINVGGTILSGLLNNIDGAVGAVSTARAELGAIENRLEHTANNLSNSSVNAAQARSRIMDTDMARAAMDRNRGGFLQQANISMMAQANINQGALVRLLG
jgi:flagellin